MSPQKNTTSSAIRRSKAKVAAKKAKKEVVTHLRPQSPGNTKIGINPLRFVEWGDAPDLFELASLVMDERIPLEYWLIVEPPAPEERGRKREKEEMSGSSSSSVSSTDKKKVPSTPPTRREKNTVPFPVGRRLERIEEEE
ncbi:hypothetical protein GLOTRDRAFT_128852 [Gloeophyllum trabeum ATCC 11539]|uniref:Uncharacterized protein n=1 Tax=Gloeophyllum trabeum (strain ATCC 11539 / FP-39264 / Madison 617) TaxID=670483 RepID=S7Q6D8_GLOTA|nr:uncharacterized protein GLOTRDRAFT_128852 [Gloeophyllum trabeum ATCC 11539]EPQ55631.1 hypothetical protein GLOTRDRAFT_128852 [Gloeophyllum trabeum ATCC 11539]